MRQRLRLDLIVGTLTADVASATQWSTTDIDAAIFTDLPTVTAPYVIPITLNALREDSVEPEIAHITAHTAGASTATIQRGMEGTTPGSFTAGMSVLVGATKADFIDDRVIDLGKALGAVGDDSTDNGTLITTGLTLASVGAAWQLLPATNFDRPLNVALGPGIFRFNSELVVPLGTGFNTAPGILGQGRHKTKLVDMRSGATKSWTFTATNGSADITVTSGTLSADDKGMVIRGTGIPARTFIVSVNTGTGAVKLSTAFTGTTGSGKSGTVITIRSMSYRGRSQGDRMLGARLEGFTLMASSATGHDNRYGILAQHASHLDLEDVFLHDFAAGIFGHDWWDSDLTYPEIQYCGSRDGGAGAGTGLGGIHLTASDQDGTDCNSIRLHHPTYENCYEHDLAIVGHGRRPNKIDEDDGAKHETSVARGHRVYVEFADVPTLAPDTEFSIGAVDSGFTGDVDAVHLVNTLGPTTDGINIEQKTGLSTATVRHGVHWAGGVRGHRPRGIRMSNGGGNPAITGKPFHCTGTNTAIPDPGGWTYDGSSTEPMTDTLPSDWVSGRIPWTPTFSGAGAPDLDDGEPVGDFSVSGTNEVAYNAWIPWGAAGDAGSGTFTIDPPIPPDLSLCDLGATSRKAGTATLVRAGGIGAGSHVIGTVHITPAGKFIIVPEVAAQTTSAYVGADNPWAWGEPDDAIHLDGQYPAGAGA